MTALLLHIALLSTDSITVVFCTVSCHILEVLTWMQRNCEDALFIATDLIDSIFVSDLSDFRYKP